MICFGGTDMFYDERIENIKGKIAHNSIFISFYFYNILILDL